MQQNVGQSEWTENRAFARIVDRHFRAFRFSSLKIRYILKREAAFQPTNLREHRAGSPGRTIQLAMTGLLAPSSIAPLAKLAADQDEGLELGCDMTTEVEKQTVGGVGVGCQVSPLSFFQVPRTQISERQRKAPPPLTQLKLLPLETEAIKAYELC